MHLSFLNTQNYCSSNDVFLKKKLTRNFFFLNFFSEPYVFTDKKLAFLKLKTLKDARLNQFKTNDEAVKFSEDGFQGLPVHYSFPKSLFFFLQIFLKQTKTKLIIFRCNGFNN